MNPTIKSVLTLAVTLLTFGPLTGGANADNYRIESSDGRIDGQFVFSGSLSSDGTFNFSSDGSPLSNANISFNNTHTPASFTFTLAGISADGTFNFGSDGSPLSNSSFAFSSGTGSNLPNQNDQYQVINGALSSLKYDAFNDQNETLKINLDNTYEVLDFFILDSGSYQVIDLGSNNYALSFSSSNGSNFANQPNQNDRYVISGGELTALKYDLFDSSSNRLNLSDDGTYNYSNASETISQRGSYTITPIPNPELLIEQAVMVQFQSTQGLLYTIEESTTLAEGEWSESATDIQGTGGVLKFFFEISEPRKFYRLQP